MGAEASHEARGTTLGRLRVDALDAFRAGLQAVDPRERTFLELGSILDDWAARRTRSARLHVLGAGKAACAMARGVEDAVTQVFGGRPDALIRGAVVCPRGHPTDTDSVEILEASHPVPGADSEVAGRRLLALASQACADDLVIVLLSGGASALLATPAPEVSREDLEEVTLHLLHSGAAIAEVNAVRKHLSGVAGGLLGLRLRGARAVCLLVSDVVGDDPSVVGSGPFYGDDSTFSESLEIVRRHGLEGVVPASVRRRLESGAAGLVEETPSPWDPRLAGIEHRIIASGIDARRAAETRCVELGYRTLLLSHTLEGEARALGTFHAGLARGVHLRGVPLPAPCALITGGEATVTVRGPGVGGRNQESCLAAAPRLAGLPAAFLSAGTDGIDGPTEAAGGLVDGLSSARARAAGVDIADVLARNDSHTALLAMGDLVVTGVTGTNVADLRIVLVAG